jgi:hypothetical protein
LGTGTSDKIHLKHAFFKYKLIWKYDMTLNYAYEVPVPNNGSWVPVCSPQKSIIGLDILPVLDYN